MNKKAIVERVYPPDCKCKALTFGTVSFYDSERKTDVVHKIAKTAIRSRQCPVHAPHNPRCGGRYLVRMVAT